MVVALGLFVMFTTTAINGARWGTGRHMDTLNEEQTTKALRVCDASSPNIEETAQLITCSIGIFATQLTVCAWSSQRFP